MDIAPMNATDEMAIELSRGKVFLMLLVTILFAAASVWLFQMNKASIREFLPRRNPLFVHGVGLAGIILAVLGGIMAVKKLFDKKPGLVLNSSGIIDNSSGITAGFIPWSEILGAEILEISHQKMLIIKVKNPEIYVDRGNSLKRFINRANYKMSGSPIAITSNTLKISFSELLAIFERYHQNYAQRMTASM